MEPPKASAVPNSHGFIKDFSTQGLHPTRQTAAEGSLELFSNSSWGEELNYPQLTEEQTSHEFTKQDPARGEGYRSIRPIAGVRAGLPRVEEQPHFCKEPLGLSCHPEDRTLDQSLFPVLVWFFSLRVLKGEICSRKSHVSIKTPGEEREDYRRAPNDG